MRSLSILVLAACATVVYSQPAGPWPRELPFPADMTNYAPARYTQSIAVSDGQDSILRFPRLRLLRKWQVNGGMETVTDFRSDLYRSEHKAKVWVGNIEVKNGFLHRGFDGLLYETTQQNRGLLRSYPDGTRFMDVLSRQGKTFEIRERLKVKQQWEYSVIYENEKSRPAGYVGVRAKDCRACHAEAGTGGYNTGLVPGGDETLSDPFPELEAASDADDGPEPVPAITQQPLQAQLFQQPQRRVLFRRR